MECDLSASLLPLADPATEEAGGALPAAYFVSILANLCNVKMNFPMQTFMALGYTL